MHVMKPREQRPVFLDLTRIHLPVMSVLSIAHRVTGVLLLLVIPAAIYLLELSLSGEAGFQQAAGWLREPVPRLLLVLLVWVFAHHFFAGIRYLLIDCGIGVRLPAGRRGAWLVIAAGVGSLFLGAGLLL